MMRVLHESLSGDDVLHWQQFLVGQGLMHDPANGMFGPETTQATIDFQRAHTLDVDGWVGDQTMGKAMGLGYSIMVAERALEDGPGWPAKPDGIDPIPSVTRDYIFGRFAYVPAPTSGNPEGIRITDGWAGESIMNVEVPQLVGVQGAPAGGKIQFHKRAVPQLLGLFQAWEDAGLLPLVQSWAGSWAPRFIRGSRLYLSNHAWGTAFDINAGWNGLGCTPALKGKPGSVRELVALAVEWGFYWGGWYSPRKDGMHFEAREIK